MLGQVCHDIYQTFVLPPKVYQTHKILLFPLEIKTAEVEAL